jgi:hypothetical protein
MVPEAFANFFLGTAGVSGALIGLLFVAISVAPERTTLLAKLQFDLRVAKAFSVFSNALVISLFALIPTIDLGTTAIIVGAVSVASCIAMALLTLREGPSGARRAELARILVQGVVFVYEIWVGFSGDGDHWRREWCRDASDPGGGDVRDRDGPYVAAARSEGHESVEHGGELDSIRAR